MGQLIKISVNLASFCCRHLRGSGTYVLQKMIGAREYRFRLSARIGISIGRIAGDDVEASEELEDPANTTILKTYLRP